MSTKRQERVMPCRGGVSTDGASIEQRISDAENLLTVPGAQKLGLFPRNGIAHLVQCTTSAVDGCRIVVVKDSDDPERTIITVRRVATGEIVSLFQHTDLQGRVRPLVEG